MAQRNAPPSGAAVQMDLLCRLVLPLGEPDDRKLALVTEPSWGLASISRDGFEALAELARSNHVIVRAFRVLANLWRQTGDTERQRWAEEALAEEQERIGSALPVLHRICEAFRSEGLPLTVIKSLDHWPDLGSDLDLYSAAPPAAVLGTMRKHFGATLAERSWGDKIAQKWNFVLPELPELVEFHVGRLGQVGEQTIMASSIHARSRSVTVDGNLTFPVTSASDRLMISTLQRMYRHFYFRLCDVLDSATLVQSGQVDFEDLQRRARACGIWPGVATYLVIVSDYIARYGMSGLDLPASVRRAARFGGNAVYVGKEFIRVPILPHSTRLFARQWLGLFFRRHLRSTARLSMLPWLAFAALIEQKRTGSDKGIW